MYRKEVHRRDSGSDKVETLIYNHSSIHSNFYIFIKCWSPSTHSPSFRLPTSNCNMSTSLPNKLPTFGVVLPRSPWTNSLMYVPALAHTSSTALCLLTKCMARQWIVLLLDIRVRRWSTLRGVSCSSSMSLRLFSLFLSSSVSSWML